MTTPTPQPPEQELLPCPFCGGDAALLHTTGHEWFVRCSNHECLSQTELFDEFSAIKRWNTRTPLAVDGNPIARNSSVNNILDGSGGRFPIASDDALLEAMTEAIQIEDADIFPTINLMRHEYAKRLAKAALKAAQNQFRGVTKLVGKEEKL